MDQKTYFCSPLPLGSLNKWLYFLPFLLVETLNQFIDYKGRHIVEKTFAEKTSLQSVFLYFLKEVVQDPEAYCKQKLVWQFVEKWQVGWQFVEKKTWSWHPVEFFFLQSAKAIKAPPK